LFRAKSSARHKDVLDLTAEKGGESVIDELGGIVGGMNIYVSVALRKRKRKKRPG